MTNKVTCVLRVEYSDVEYPDEIISAIKELVEKARESGYPVKAEVSGFPQTFTLDS